jgi:hypothetical protein
VLFEEGQSIRRVSVGPMVVDVLRETVVVVEGTEEVMGPAEDELGADVLTVFATLAVLVSCELVDAAADLLSLFLPARLPPTPPPTAAAMIMNATMAATIQKVLAARPHIRLRFPRWRSECPSAAILSEYTYAGLCASLSASCEFGREYFGNCCWWSIWRSEYGSVIWMALTSNNERFSGWDAIRAGEMVIACIGDA